MESIDAYAASGHKTSGRRLVEVVLRHLGCDLPALAQNASRPYQQRLILATATPKEKEYTEEDMFAKPTFDAQFGVLC